MSDLLAFLRARLDEDEAAAKDANDDCTPSPWRDDVGDLQAANGELIVDGVGYGGAAWANSLAVTHIARHDPARVLREVQAKRAILELNKAVLDEQADYWPFRVLRHLAAVYSDHPDYQQEWAS